MQCSCGRDLFMKKETLTTRYKGESFTIRNVPTYLCELDHIRFTIGSRRRIKILLKNAYETGLKEIEYTT